MPSKRLTGVLTHICLRHVTFSLLVFFFSATPRCALVTVAHAKEGGRPPQLHNSQSLPGQTPVHRLSAAYYTQYRNSSHWLQAPCVAGLPRV